MSTTKEDSVTRLQKLTELCRLAFAFDVKVQENTEAKSRSVKEALKYATLHNISKTDVILAFTTAGFTGIQARGYASQIGVVQRDETAKEKLAKDQVSFGKAVKSARTNRKEADPDNLPPLLHKAYGEAARLAVKSDLNKDEHLKRSLLAYEEKLAQKRNAVV